MEMSGYGYKCSAGESFDTVALDVYGDEKYSSELLSANPEHCGKIAFTGGEMLLLPVVEVPEDEDMELPETAPWKE